MNGTALYYVNETFNSTNVYNVSENALEVFTKVLYVYGIPVICLFGIIGNFVCFKVFVFTILGNQSSSTYIAALSLSDAGFLMSLFLSWLSNGRIGLQYGHHPIWCHALIYVTYVCSFLSVWYVVLIMVDRYIVVCHSLRVTELCTKRNARKATAAVTIFGMTIYLHTFFTAFFTGESCAAQPRPFMLEFLTIFIYTDTAITVIIPYALIFILNVIIIISIRRFRTRHVILRDRKKGGSLSKPNVLTRAQLRITRTFTLVSVVMLVTNVPSHGIRFYILLNQLIMLDINPTLVYAQHVFQIIYYANFAVNFLLYSVSSEKFRKYVSLKHLCHVCIRRRNLRNNDHLYR